ncbi:hypothetical protein LG3211_1192 [Lysobacter gummosus]|nr:hypothetical protein LG3211_1192 [Lysobacter gummosus]
MRSEVPMQFAQVQELINAAEQMVRWNVIFKVEGIEQRHLAGFLASHHRVDFRSIDGTSVNQHQMTDSTEFFNGIDPERTAAVGRNTELTARSLIHANEEGP